MEIKIVENEEELGRFVSDIVQETIINKNRENKNAVIGLATGTTPIPVYKELSKRYSEGKIDFNKTISFNLDEYIGLDYSNENSYHKFMEENLFKHININKDNIYIPDGNSSNLEDEANKYDKLITDVGGIDIQLLGIGENGHIGFNEPYQKLNLNTNIADLSESTINANSRFFKSKDEVPKKAITMGMGTIFSANKIVLMATGKKKKEAIKKLLTDFTINTESPASFLKLHKDFTVVIDKELYDEINSKNEEL